MHVKITQNFYFKLKRQRDIWIERHRYRCRGGQKGFKFTNFETNDQDLKETKLSSIPSSRYLFSNTCSFNILLKEDKLLLSRNNTTMIIILGNFITTSVCMLTQNKAFSMFVQHFHYKTNLLLRILSIPSNKKISSVFWDDPELNKDVR